MGEPAVRAVPAAAVVVRSGDRHRSAGDGGVRPLHAARSTAAGGPRRRSRRGARQGWIGAGGAVRLLGRRRRCARCSRRPIRSARRVSSCTRPPPEADRRPTIRGSGPKGSGRTTSAESGRDGGPGSTPKRRSPSSTRVWRATRAMLVWWERFQRLSASPSALYAQEQLFREMDIRQLLPAISVPTLVLHRAEDVVEPVGAGRYLARQIAGAEYVELAGARSLSVGGRPERTAQRGRAVRRHGRQRRAGDVRSHPRHDPVHGHRRLDLTGGGDGRSPVA